MLPEDWSESAFLSMGIHANSESPRIRLGVNVSLTSLLFFSWLGLLDERLRPLYLALGVAVVPEDLRGRLGVHVSSMGLLLVWLGLPKTWADFLSLGSGVASNLGLVRAGLGVHAS